MLFSIQKKNAADTPYQGGAFRVKLKLGAEFPAAPPKGYFLTKIFHPNVAKHGEICVNTLKRDWKEDLGIGHILLVRHHRSFVRLLGDCRVCRP